MRTLSEELPIETWKRIATKIQRLKLEGYTDENFLKNLMLLRGFLEKEMINVGTLERKPKYTPQIGAASLLQSIYDIKVGIHQKKAAFYENIFALDELGIKNISFHPIPTSYEEFPFIEHQGSINRMHKILTDGNFTLTSSKYTNRLEYHMSDIKDASYLLELSLIKENKTVILHSSKAIIKNFNAGDALPTKEEITSLSFPKKTILLQDSLDWDESPRIKQKFETFDKSHSEFSKRYVLAKENYYK